MPHLNGTNWALCFVSFAGNIVPLLAGAVLFATIVVVVTVVWRRRRLVHREGPHTAQLDLTSANTLEEAMSKVREYLQVSKKQPPQPLFDVQPTLATALLSPPNMPQLDAMIRDLSLCQRQFGDVSRGGLWSRLAKMPKRAVHKLITPHLQPVYEFDKTAISAFKEIQQVLAFLRHQLSSINGELLANGACEVRRDLEHSGAPERPATPAGTSTNADTIWQVMQLVWENKVAIEALRRAAQQIDQRLKATFNEELDIVQREFASLKCFSLDQLLRQESWDIAGRDSLKTLLSGIRRLSFPRVPAPEISIIVVLFNSAHLSLLCLESILANADVPYELVIVDNCSDDGTSDLLQRLDGAEIIRNQVNVGFGTACMQAAQRARGDYLCFLNNDALLEPLCLSTAIRNFHANPSVGAVGAKVIGADRKLQEAGCMVWNDGAAWGYGRGDKPDLPQYAFRRPVDYCSGVFLLTQRSVFNLLGGFDECFAPAYYEDTDYCMKLWEGGLSVVYEPSAVIRHYECASSGSNEKAKAAIARNRARFTEKWKTSLEQHYRCSGDNILRARISVYAKGLRILYVSDHLLVSESDDGFCRAAEISRQLAALGHHITCAVKQGIQVLTEYRNLPREVEFLEISSVSERAFREYLEAVDLIWIDRPCHLCDLVAAITALPAVPKIVYDATDINHEALRPGPTTLENGAVPERDQRTLIRLANVVIVGSEHEQEELSYLDVPCHVLKSLSAPIPTPNDFDERNAFLLIAAKSEANDISADSIRYFCRDIWPRLRQATGARLIVVGEGLDVDVEAVQMLGFHEDLISAYNAARVFVAAARFGSGIPLQIYEVALRGVPMVVSTLVHEHADLRDTKDYWVARSTAGFVNACTSVYCNKESWYSLRASAMRNVMSRVNSGEVARMLGVLTDAGLFS